MRFALRHTCHGRIVKTSHRSSASFSPPRKAAVFSFDFRVPAVRSIPMKQLPHTHSCFVCGDSNPIGFNLRAETDGRTVRAHFVFGTGHVGFKNVVHGGLTATLLDEIMTWACAVKTKR